MSLFGFILFWPLWASWTWMTASFHWLEKSSYVFLLLSLFSLLEPLQWWMLFCLMLYHRSLKRSSLFKTPFILLLCLGEIHSLSVPDPFCCFFWSCYEPLWCIFSFIEFYSSVTCLQYFLMFSSFCWSSHCVHPFFSRLVSIIMTIILNSLSSKEFGSLLRAYFVLWFGRYYFTSSLCLTLHIFPLCIKQNLIYIYIYICIYIYIYITSPCLKAVTICNWNLLFNFPQVPGCFSNLCDFLRNLIYSW